MQKPGLNKYAVTTFFLAGVLLFFGFGVLGRHDAAAPIVGSTLFLSGVLSILTGILILALANRP